MAFVQALPCREQGAFAVGIDRAAFECERDLVAIALKMGATFVELSFSADTTQLVPLIAAAIQHKGAAFIDVISPCVAFNNHAGSTRSYDHVRAHNEALNRIDFIDLAEEQVATGSPDVVDVPQADGSTLRLRKVAADYDPTDRLGAMNAMQLRAAAGEIATGLLYVDPAAKDWHAAQRTAAQALNSLGEKALCPGAAALEKINAGLR